MQVHIFYLDMVEKLESPRKSKCQRRTRINWEPKGEPFLHQIPKSLLIWSSKSLFIWSPLIEKSEVSYNQVFFSIVVHETLVHIFGDSLRKISFWIDFQETQFSDWCFWSIWILGCVNFHVFGGFLDLGLLKLMNFELGFTCIWRISKFSTKPFIVRLWRSSISCFVVPKFICRCYVI